MREGAIAPWAKTGATSPYYMQTLEALAKHYKVSMTTPGKTCRRSSAMPFCNGTGEEEISITYDDGLRTYKTKKPLKASSATSSGAGAKPTAEWMREELARYQSDHPCHDCNGHRLKPQALAVKIDELHIGQVAAVLHRRCRPVVHRS